MHAFKFMNLVEILLNPCQFFFRFSILKLILLIYLKMYFGMLIFFHAYIKIQHYQDYKNKFHLQEFWELHTLCTGESNISVMTWNVFIILKSFLMAFANYFPMPRAVSYWSRFYLFIDYSPFLELYINGNTHFLFYTYWLFWRYCLQD